MNFDDITLLPQFNRGFSRDEVSLAAHLGGKWHLRVPFVSSPMTSVTGIKMCKAMWDAGGVGILHRFQSIDDQVAAYKEIYERPELVVKSDCGAAVGVQEGYDRIKALFQEGCTLFCVDVAHGYSQFVADYMDGLPSDIRHHGTFILGNVCTGEAAEFLAIIGADCIRVGVGSGSACTTRMVTGHGQDQPRAIQECYEAIKGSKNKHGMPIQVMACGGIRNSGDVVKALALGASTVMLGGLLAGCPESPEPGVYYGQASRRAGEMRYPEGTVYSVPRSEDAKETIAGLSAGVRSGLSYSGCKSIVTLKERARYA